MPTVVNGIGTWYWGKSNVFVREDICPRCGRFAKLTSFDSTKFFVVFFIPVVPLGRLRVLEKCSLCTQHHAIKLSVWRAAHQQAAAQAIAAWEAAPRDAERADGAVTAAIATQDAPLMSRIAAGIGKLPAVPAAIWSSLAEGHAYFGEHQRAEECYRKALEQQHDPGVAERFAIHLLREGQLFEARPHIDAALDRRSAMGRHLAHLGVEAYQAEGNHEEALELIERAEAAAPDLRGDTAWNKRKKLSEKHRATGKVIKSEALHAHGRVQESRRGGRLFKPTMVLPLILLLAAAGILFGDYYRGQHRKVYLVNGLDASYTAMINGVPYALRGHGRRELDLTEGRVKVHVQESELGIPDQEASVSTSFWWRIFRKDAFVLNPDRVAIIVWHEAEYSARPSPDAKPRYLLYTGEVLQHHTHVEYPFQELPETVQIDSGSSTTKRGLMQLTSLDPDEEVAAVAARTNKEKAIDFALLHPLRRPEEEGYLVAVANLIEPPAFLERLRPMLDDRPLRVEAHRVYQYYIEKSDPHHQLVAEYQALLDKEPASADAMYLLARVTRAPAQRMELYHRAAQADAAHVRARGSIAYCNSMAGRFDEALAQIEGVLKDAPQVASLQQVRQDLQEAQLTPDALLAALPTGPFEASDFETVSLRTRALVRANRRDDAVKLREVYIGGLKKHDLDEKEIAGAAAWLTGEEAYVAGDFAGAAAALEKNDDYYARAVAAILKDELLAADIRLAGHTPVDEHLHLALLVAAEAAGHFADFERTQDRLVQALAAGDDEDRSWADWLTGRESPTAEALLGAGARTIQDKAMLVLLVGRRNPALRGSCYELAGKLNVLPQFPQHLIRAALERPAPSGGAERGED